jgi:hypothetical protein
MADRVAEIRARLAAATPGPWNADAQPIRVSSGAAIAVAITMPNVRQPLAAGDASLIAAAPADLEWACGEIERLTRERDAERAQVDRDWSSANELHEAERNRNLTRIHNLEAQVTAMKLAAIAAHEAVWRAMNAPRSEALASLRDDGYVHEAVHKIVAVETESVTAMDAWRAHIEQQDARIDRLEAERDAAYRDGTAAMREAIVEILVEDECDELVSSVRLLPIPEPKR